MPSPRPTPRLLELITDELVRRILQSRGGMRLLAMSDQEMQQFLSSAEGGLTLRSAEDEAAVKASIEDARVRSELRYDLCLGGGGVPSAVGLAGAVTVLEESGYAVRGTAGASGGALVAALLATGYSAAELREILLSVDYRALLQRRQRPRAVDRDRGSFDYVTEWIDDLLGSRGVRTFGDLRWTDSDNRDPYQRYKLVLMAIDNSRGRLVKLPWDYRLLNLNPRDQFVTDALAAALALPDVFEPVPVRSGKTGEVTLLADAGMHAAGMVEVFDRTDDEVPRWPTFGVWIGPELPAAAQVSYRDRDRMIIITNTYVAPTDFDVSREKALALYDQGRSATERFLREWDFHRHLRTRGKLPTSVTS